MRSSWESCFASERGSLPSTPDILTGSEEWKKGYSLEWEHFSRDGLLELRVCAPYAAPQLEATVLSTAPTGPEFAQPPQPQGCHPGWIAQPQSGPLAPASLKRRCPSGDGRCGCALLKESYSWSPATRALPVRWRTSGEWVQERGLHIGLTCPEGTS